jgi:OOP family OmpA-OmpF porin
MKKIGVLIVFFMLMAVITPVQAGVKAGSVSFTPFAGYYVFEKNQSLRDSPVYGVRAGYNITENIGVEGYFSYLQTELKDYWDGWQDVYGYGVEGLYHFMPEGRIVPFIALGVGGMHYSKGYTYPGPGNTFGDRFESNNFAVDYGAGVKFFLTDNIALRADVRHVLPINDRYDNPNRVHNDFLAALGVSFSFGGAATEVKVEELKAEEPPAPLPEVVMDFDKDGVPDNLDKCPGTPAGVAVDKDGCPLDSDKDGVPDYLDKCPGTPEGIAVDKDGCPLDSDKDGVPDYLDKCPGTPAGTTVDKDGCPPPPPPPVIEQKPVVTEKVSITLNVEFSTAKATIKEKYRDEIKKVADFMKAHPETSAVIEGHTDNVDIYHEPKRNMKLSQARADSVRKYLIEKFGINASRITAVGYGPAKPIAGNDTAEGRKKNRRIQAVIEAMEVK